MYDREPEAEDHFVYSTQLEAMESPGWGYNPYAIVRTARTEVGGGAINSFFIWWSKS
jgi:hypothetical protein